MCLPARVTEYSGTKHNTIKNYLVPRHGAKTVGVYL